MLVSSGAVGMNLKRRVAGAENLKSATFMFQGQPWTETGVVPWTDPLLVIGLHWSALGVHLHFSAIQRAPSAWFPDRRDQEVSFRSSLWTKVKMLAETLTWMLDNVLCPFLKQHDESCSVDSSKLSVSSMFAEHLFHTSMPSLTLYAIGR